MAEKAILYTIQKITEKIYYGKCKYEEVDEDLIQQHLYSSSVSEIDLLIRTGDEKEFQTLCLGNSVILKYFFLIYYGQIFLKKI